MGSLFLLAAVLAVFGLGTLFLTPWVGGPLLLAALVLGVIGVVVGGTAAAADADVTPGEGGVEAPHLPGPDGRETRAD